MYHDSHMAMQLKQYDALYQRTNNVCDIDFIIDHVVCLQASVMCSEHVFRTTIRQHNIYP